MNTVKYILPFLFVLLGGHLELAIGQTVIFRDDFSGTALNQQAWGIGTWKVGRTQLGNAPTVANGMARLNFDTYRFRGTEIYSKALFSKGTGIEFEARIRLNQLPSGLVPAFFTYIYDNATNKSDELDIEILTKQVNLKTGGDPVLFTSWNNWDENSPTYQDGIHHWSIDQFLAGLDVNVWHTYIIRWLPTSTQWLIDGVVVATSDKAQPDAATPLRLNFWAPASGWTEAYSSSLSPTTSANNKRYTYDVDWVEVRRLP